MKPSPNHDTRNILIGGLLGIVIAILLTLYETGPRWNRVIIAGSSDPTDKVTQIVGYDGSKKILYVQMQSGIVYGCHDSMDFFITPEICQKVEIGPVLLGLKESYQCKRMIFPTLTPPGTPISQIESYPCGLGQYQTNHIVLADGTVWQLSQSIAEDQEYWIVIAVIGVGIFGFAAGMIGTAILIALRRRLCHSSK